METKKIALFFITTVVMFIIAASAQASVVQLEPITPNAANYEYPELNIYVNAYEEDSLAYFQFVNNSEINSSIAAIYFDEYHFASVVDIITPDEDNVAFGIDSARPRELPQAGLYDPSFETSISFGSEKPPYHQGINPGEDMTIIFELNDSPGSLNWIEDFEDGLLRVGAHIIGLPDGSSYPAVSTPIPEPATLSILGLGSMVLLTSRKKVYAAVAKTPKQLLMFVLILTVAFAGNTYAMISDGNLEQLSNANEIPYQITLLDVTQDNDNCVECLESDNFFMGSNSTMAISLDQYDSLSYDLLKGLETLSLISDQLDSINLSKISLEMNLFSSNN